MSVLVSPFSSGEVIDKILNGKYPFLPKVRFGCVDVRDVAQAHLLAIQRPEAANKRFILVERSFWMTELGEILAKDFKQHSYSVVTKECPKWMASIASVFLSELAQTMKVWGVKTEFDNTQSREVLGVTYPIPME